MEGLVGLVRGGGGGVKGFQGGSQGYACIMHETRDINRREGLIFWPNFILNIPSLITPFPNLRRFQNRLPRKL